jgi:hypothetical protein
VGQFEGHIPPAAKAALISWQLRHGSSCPSKNLLELEFFPQPAMQICHLSEAKDLLSLALGRKQILRFAQKDKLWDDKLCKVLL